MSILNYLAQTLHNGDIKNLPTISADQALHNTLGIVYWIAGVVAVIVIIVAGFVYTTSSGDQARVTKAKNAILYSVVGLVVIALAFVITQFVIGRF